MPANLLRNHGSRLLIGLFCMVQLAHASPPLALTSFKQNGVSALKIDTDRLSYDDELTDSNGLTYLMTRFYGNNSTFISEDAFANDTLNRYAGLGSDPVDHIDPRGEKSEAANVAANGIIKVVGGSWKTPLKGILGDAVNGAMGAVSTIYQYMNMYTLIASTGANLALASENNFKGVKGTDFIPFHQLGNWHGMYNIGQNVGNIVDIFGQLRGAFHDGGAAAAIAHLKKQGATELGTGAYGTVLRIKDEVYKIYPNDLLTRITRVGKFDPARAARLFNDLNKDVIRTNEFAGAYVTQVKGVDVLVSPYIKGRQYIHRTDFSKLSRILCDRGRVMLDENELGNIKIMEDGQLVIIDVDQVLKRYRGESYYSDSFYQNPITKLAGYRPDNA